MNETDFHSLTVKQIVNETNDTVTVKFSVPTALKDDFDYSAGQYLTLRFFIDGQDVRRAYSMSSSPFEDELAVTVKRVKGGVVSNHIADELEVGSSVSVMSPQGRFLVKPDGANRHDYYLIGAGSGITPLMSIAKTVLEAEPKSSVYLLYGSRDENSIIFKEAIEALEKRYAGQFFVRHTLSQPVKEKTGGFSGFFTRGKISWTGERGRIDADKLHDFLDTYPSDGEQENYFLCGPGSLIDTAEEFLLGRGVDKNYIHSERFVSAHDAKKDTKSSSTLEGAAVKAKIDGKEVNITLKPGQSILDGLLEAKAEPPYSCLAGACSTCAAKVIKGGVKMDVCYALDDDEVASGMILTCQSHPTTPEVEVDFEL